MISIKNRVSETVLIDVARCQQERALALWLSPFIAKHTFSNVFLKCIWSRVPKQNIQSVIVYKMGH